MNVGERHLQLVNGSTGDPVLYVDYPERNDALLFDAGDNAALPMERLADLRAVFITHHHVDHFIGLDRIVRANIDSDKQLAIYGPAGTIRKVYDRIKSYEYQFFPFQKIVLRVCEIHPDRLDAADLECRRRFPEPVVESRPWTGPIFDGEDLVVEAALVDHTVPCVAYALKEKPGYHLAPDLLEKGLLRPGRWIDEVYRRLREAAAMDSIVEVEGGRFTLQALANSYFRKRPGAKIAFVTDTAWSAASRPVLQKLVDRADRLYCDAFYLRAQQTQADRHRHMTAFAAGQLATMAHVGELVLIHFATRYRGQYQRLVDEAREAFTKTTAEF